MPLILETDSFPERPVLIIIAGTPFSYKTSLGITSLKPLLLDSEFGGERAHGRVATFRPKGWAEVEAELQLGLLNDYKTLVIDTVKATIDDQMWEYALSINYTKNKQKTYGDVGDLFKKFVAKVRGAGLDIVAISHEKSKDEDDARIYDLDITGGSKNLLLRMADQVGFAFKQQLKTTTGIITQTVITFNPKKEWPFCKNVAGLPDIVLPDCNADEWKGFMEREIIAPTKTAISKMGDAQKEALAFLSEWYEKIDGLTPSHEAFITISDDMKKIPAERKVLVAQISAALKDKLKAEGWKWDKEFDNGTGVAKGKFVAITKEADTPVVTEPTVEDTKTPPVEPTPTEQPEKEDFFAAKQD